MGFLNDLLNQMKNLTGEGKHAKPTVRLCPVDSAKMEVMRIKFKTGEVVEIDRCPACGGIWLDRGELNQLIRVPAKQIERIFGTLGRKVSVKGSGENRQCPVCGSLMITYNYDYRSGIWLDACPKGHGIWLDAGELLLLKLYLEKGQRFESVAHLSDIKTKPMLRKVQTEGREPLRKKRLQELERELEESVKRLMTGEEPEQELRTLTGTDGTLRTRREVEFPPLQEESEFSTGSRSVSSYSETNVSSKVDSKFALKGLGDKEDKVTETVDDTATLSTGYSVSTGAVVAGAGLGSSILAKTKTDVTSTADRTEDVNLRFEKHSLGGYWAIRDMCIINDKVLIVGDSGNIFLAGPELKFQKLELPIRDNLLCCIEYNDKIVIGTSYGALYIIPTADLLASRGEPQKISLDYSAVNAMAVHQGKLVVVCSGSKIFYTSDLNEFKEVKLPVFSDLNSVLSFEGKLIVVGSSGTIFVGPEPDNLNRLDSKTSSNIRRVKLIAGEPVLVGSSSLIAKLKGSQLLSVNLSGFEDFRDLEEIRGNLLITGSSGKIFRTELKSLWQEPKLDRIEVGEFSTFNVARRYTDRILVGGEKSLLIEFRF